jgi:hypothetical protein
MFPVFRSMFFVRQSSTLKETKFQPNVQHILTNPIILGRAIAQAVSRWLPTAVARVQARVWLCGICGGQSGAGAGFLWVLWFPLPIFIPPVVPQSPSSIIWGLYNRPEVAAVRSGLRPTPLKKTILTFGGKNLIVSTGSQLHIQIKGIHLLDSSVIFRNFYSSPVSD